MNDVFKMLNDVREKMALLSARESGLEQAEKNLRDLADKYPTQAKTARNLLMTKSEDLAKDIGEIAGYLSIAPTSVAVAGLEFLAAYLLFTRLAILDIIQEEIGGETSTDNADIKESEKELVESKD